MDKEWAAYRSGLLLQCGFFAFIMWPVLLVLYLIGFSDPFFTLFYAFLVVPLIFVTWYAMEVYFHHTSAERGLHTGLFEKGLQFRVRNTRDFIFIPYGEIEEFTVTRWALATVIYIQLQGRVEPIRVGHLDQVLGEGGLSALRRLISKHTDTPTPHHGSALNPG